MPASRTTPKKPAGAAAGRTGDRNDSCRELESIGRHITADGRLLEERAASLAKYTEKVVAESLTLSSKKKLA